MKKILLFNLITITLLLGCGSKKSIEGNNAQAMYNNVVNELGKDDGGIFGFFSAKDYEMIEETLKEIHVITSYSIHYTKLYDKL